MTQAVPSAPTGAEFVRWWNVLHDGELNALDEGLDDFGADEGNLSAVKPHLLSAL